jgi:RNA polymerase-binding protein DksA
MKKKRLNENHLTPEEIAEFKAMLLSKVKEIFGDVAIMENGTLRKEMSDLSHMPIHMADQGTDNYNEEFNLDLMESERKLLIEIYNALDRIEDGTYGICDGSGKPIPKARLEAIPWAKYCVEYANMLEKGLAAKDFDEIDSEDQIDEEQNDNLYSTEK